MKWIVAVIFMMSFSISLSQDKTQDQIDAEKRAQEAAKQAESDSAANSGWGHSLIATLDLSQVSFQDWAQGGSNSLSYVGRLRGQSTDKAGKILWINTYKFAYGESRLGGQGLRKTDDEIYAEALLIYKMGVYINPYVAATFRTQFAQGFTYDDTGKATATSKFFDPAYITQSAGVAYKPVDEVTTRLGVALREVLTSDYPFYADDPATPEIENTRVEGGLESVTDVNWEFAKNMLLTSRLEMFSPFKTMDRIIVRNDNIIAAKVNDYIVTSLSLQLINDVTQTPRTQVKEMISLGITYSLL